MDLSNLSSDLPPTKPVTQTSIDDLSRELTTEFKNAAKSVAKLYNSSSSSNSSAANQKAEFANAARSVAALYRITHNATSLLKYNGYLNCLDDLLEVIANDGDTENWALTKRAEITNMNNTSESVETPTTPTINTSNNTSTIAESVPPPSDFQFPLDFKFNFNHDIKPKYPIVPSYTPLSVSHLHQLYRPGTRKNEFVKDKSQSSSPSKSISSSDEDIDDRVVLKKLKLDQMKKKWKKSASDHNTSS